MLRRIGAVKGTSSELDDRESRLIAKTRKMKRAMTPQLPSYERHLLEAQRVAHEETLARSCNYVHTRLERNTQLVRRRNRETASPGARTMARTNVGKQVTAHALRKRCSHVLVCD